MTFPRVDILPAAQQRLWRELIDVPTSFTLYDDLREALDQAPPGIIDPRSWAY